MNTKYFKLTLGIALVCMTGFTSCEDQPDEYARTHCGQVLSSIRLSVLWVTTCAA